MDDSSYSVGCDTPEDLTEKLSNVYLNISTYMTANKLILNDEKTHLIVFTKKAHSDRREDVFIEAGKHIIKPTATEKLLGCHIAQDGKWKEHILNNKSSLVKQLNKRLNGLSLVCRRAPFKTKLMVAGGIFLSKLVYLIQVWGGTQEFLLKALQVTQNKAMKMVTELS